MLLKVERSPVVARGGGVMFQLASCRKRSMPTFVGAAVVAWLAAGSQASASTGCDSANAGDFDSTATLALGVNLDFGGDFDDGDVLHFVTSAGTLLFTLVNLPSLTLMTLTGSDSGDYTIPATATYSFNMVLTTLTTADVTVTCTAAPIGPGGGGGGGDPGDGGDSAATTTGATVDRLLAAGLWGADDTILRDAQVRRTDIRHEFLSSLRATTLDQVAALRLLHGVAPGDAVINSRLAEATARANAILDELGSPPGAGPSGSLPPTAMPLIDPATTGAITPASGAAALLAGGGDGMQMRLRLSPDAAATISYRQVADGGMDGMRGWTLAGTQSLDLPASDAFSSGLFAMLRYSDASTGDGTASTRTIAYGAGGRAALALGERMTLRAAALYERGDSTATVDGAMGSFSSDRFRASAELAGTAWAGPFRLAPHLGVSYEDIWRHAYVDSASNAVPQSQLQQATVVADGEIDYSAIVSAWPRLITMHPFARGGVEWNFLRVGGTSTDFDPGVVLYRAGGGMRVYWSADAWFALSASYLMGSLATGIEANAELNLPLFARPGNVARGTLQLAATANQSGLTSANARAILPLQ